MTWWRLWDLSILPFLLHRHGKTAMMMLLHDDAAPLRTKTQRGHW
jgi:hypothetical protein